MSTRPNERFSDGEQDPGYDSALVLLAGLLIRVLVHNCSCEIAKRLNEMIGVLAHALDCLMLIRGARRAKNDE
jgi:hypothetical protein